MLQVVHRGSGLRPARQGANAQSHLEYIEIIDICMYACVYVCGLYTDHVGFRDIRQDSGE